MWPPTTILKWIYYILILFINIMVGYLFELWFLVEKSLSNKVWLSISSYDGFERLQ